MEKAAPLLLRQTRQIVALLAGCSRLLYNIQGPGIVTSSVQDHDSDSDYNDYVWVELKRRELLMHWSMSLNSLICH